jgi:hypothetical protein
MWGDIKYYLLKVLASCVPSKMSGCRFSEPWIKKDIKQLSRRTKGAYARAKSTKSHQSMKRYEDLEKKCRLACQEAYNEYVNSTSSTAFFKSKKTDSQGVEKLKAKAGMTHSNSNTKVSFLNEQFSSVFNKDEDISTIPDTEPG